MPDEKKTIMHLDLADQDPSIPDSQPEKCPHCGAGHESYEIGYGMGGGGKGAYTYCRECGNIIHKTQDEI